MRAKPEAVPGRLALSKAGRDSGRYFVILRVEEPYAWIADGAVRPVRKPKKKKLKHLRLTPFVLEGAEQTLESGRTPDDGTLRKMIDALTKRRTDFV